MKITLSAILLLGVVALASAKLGQHNGKVIFNRAFKDCKTSAEDKKAMRRFDIPSSNAAAGCVIVHFWKEFNLVKPDGTTDVEGVKQQFRDYDREIPADTDTLAGINVETEREKLGELTFKWLNNNKDAIRYVYYGNAKETFE